MKQKAKKEQSIIAYKAFDKDFKCRGLQYKVDSEMPELKDAIPCNIGYHSCENPLDVLNYYDLINSRFAIVDASGKIARDENNTKLASTKIKIKAELRLGDYIKASVNYLIEKIKPTKSTAASGHYSQLAASGDSSQLAASGHYSKLAASGDSSQLAASGDSSKLAASGDSSQLAASGDYSQLAASGDYSKLEITGKNSVGAAIGINNRIKGILGTWITLAEYIKEDGKYICICVKSAKIDGKKIKADTWYKLENKKFVEVK